MEDVLALYEKPYEPQEPVVCLDEKPVSLHAEVRQPIPVAPGRWVPLAPTRIEDFKTVAEIRTQTAETRQFCARSKVESLSSDRSARSRDDLRGKHIGFEKT